MMDPVLGTETIDLNPARTTPLVLNLELGILDPFVYTQPMSDELPNPDV